MSSTLTIEPNKRKKTSLSYELKKVLQKRYGGVINEQILDESDISYIKGLIDSEISGAKVILEYIEKYGEVIINEEF